MTDDVAERYALSFTSGALMTQEAAVAVPVYLEEQDWARVRVVLGESNLLQARTASSGFRLAREVVQRLSALNPSELELLMDATSGERAYLMWAAACRRYALVGEFAEEVVRERFLLLTPSLGAGDFDAFVRGKALWHPELETAKPSTMQKLRSTLFRMLSDAGLVAEGRVIPASLSGRVLDALRESSPSDVRFFPVHEAQEGAR